MPDYVIAPPPRVAIPVRGRRRLPRHTASHCIGRKLRGPRPRDWDTHPDKEHPFFFKKNPDNLDPRGRLSLIRTSVILDVHHRSRGRRRCLTVRRNTTFRSTPALDHVFGYALAPPRHDPAQICRRGRKSSAVPREIGKAYRTLGPGRPGPFCLQHRASRQRQDHPRSER